MRDQRWPEDWPPRLQRRRRRGWRKPDGAVIVDRTSRWGNPYRIDTWGRLRALEQYSAHLLLSPALIVDIRAELAGRPLLCPCPPQDADGRRMPCHGDLLIAVANTSGGQRDDVAKALRICCAERITASALRELVQPDVHLGAQR